MAKRVEHLVLDFTGNSAEEIAFIAKMEEDSWEVATCRGNLPYTGTGLIRYIFKRPVDSDKEKLQRTEEEYAGGRRDFQNK